MLLSRRDGASTLDRILHSGVLRVGSTLDYAPFALACGGGTLAVGSDVDQAADLAASLGARLVLVPTSWPRLIDDAAAGRFDIGVGGIGISLARRRRVGFSAPYAHGGKVAVARCGSPLLDALREGTGLSAVDGSATRVVVNPGGTNEAMVRSQLAHSALQLVAQGAQSAALLSDTADLTVTDEAEARLLERRHPALLCASGLLSRASKAYLLPRDDGSWQRYVDAWLGARLESGAVNASVEAWSSRLAQDEGDCEGGVEVVGGG